MRLMRSIQALGQYLSAVEESKRNPVLKRQNIQFWNINGSRFKSLKVFFMNIIMLLFRRVKASVVLLMRAPTGMLQASAVHTDCRIFPQFFGSRHLEGHPGISAMTALL